MIRSSITSQTICDSYGLWSIYIGVRLISALITCSPIIPDPKKARSIRQFSGATNEFSNASSLQANLSKSSIYFGGVSAEVQERIPEEFQFKTAFLSNILVLHSQPKSCPLLNVSLLSRKYLLELTIRPQYFYQIYLIQCRPTGAKT